MRCSRWRSRCWRSSTSPDDRKARLIAELATASGTVGGMIGGQVADLEGEGKPPDAQLLETIHRAKTGALLRASLRMGAIYARRRRGAVRRALLLRRARRAGVPDCGRHPGRGGIVRGARQDRRQGRAAAQDHLPGGLWPGDLAAHGGGGVRARPRRCWSRSASARCAAARAGRPDRPAGKVMKTAAGPAAGGARAGRIAREGAGADHGGRGAA